jgi:predicted permease
MANRISRLFRALFHNKRAESEMRRELQFHLEMETRKNVAAGMTPEEGHAAAKRSFGAIEQIKEICRDIRGARFLDELRRDLAYGFRMLRKNPAFTASVILCLTLGIGATTAIFSVVNAILLRPLPFHEPDRLVMVSNESAGSGARRRITTSTGPDFTAWRGQSDAFEQVEAYFGPYPANLAGGAESLRVRTAEVTAGFFAMLGTGPLLGRAFNESENPRGPTPIGDSAEDVRRTVAIIGYSLWQSYFDKDPQVIGKTVKVDSAAVTVVGIMPAEFGFPEGAQLWLPVTISEARDNTYLTPMARLKPGISREAAQAEMDSVTSRLSAERLDRDPDAHIRLAGLQEFLAGDVKQALLIFLSAVFLLLLIACANVANLLLARTTARQKEIALRLALGASRSRIVRQLLTESSLFAFLGGSLGLLLAWFSLNTLIDYLPSAIPRLNSAHLDGAVLGLTLLTSLTTGILFGIAPALQVSRAAAGNLKDGSRSSSGSGQVRMRGVLVVFETALALILLIGSGLLANSFLRLRQIHLGFATDNVLTMNVVLPGVTYRTKEQVRDYCTRALTQIHRIAGVQAAATSSAIPLGEGMQIFGDLTVEGASEEKSNLAASKLAVSEEYFRAMEIPLLKGRSFTDRDTEQSPGVVIVSESLALSAWPGEEPLGKRIAVGFRGEVPREVVGVVGDVKQNELEAQSPNSIYQPYLQVSRIWQLSAVGFAIRSPQDSRLLASDLRRALKEVDNEIPAYNLKPMKQVVSEKTADPRFYTTLLGCFSALALILAAAGIYGVMAYSVSERSHEIGIRMTLGARPGGVARMVVTQGFSLSLLGLALGLIGAFALTRFLKGFLYGIEPTDPMTFLLVSLVLAGVSLFASYLPARRATRVDPMLALRQE